MSDDAMAVAGDLADLFVQASEEQMKVDKKKKKLEQARLRQAAFRERARERLGDELHKKLHAVGEFNRCMRIQVADKEKAMAEVELSARAEALKTSEGVRRVTRLQEGAIKAKSITHGLGDEGHLDVVREGGCLGRGVMALKDYDEGEIIAVYAGKTVGEKAKQAALARGNDVMIRITTDAASEHRYINPRQLKSNVLQYINHACHDCEANCELGPGGDGELVMTAWRPIKRFTYLRWDYRIWPIHDGPGLGWLRTYWSDHDKLGKCEGASRYET